MAHNVRQSISAMSRRLSGDRRGATAVLFALGATALLGFAGLATEGGSWYLEKRHGQNAADAAAIAGALAFNSGQSVTTSGNKAAELIGYTSGVTITTGVFNSGAYTANATPANAVRAVVTKAQPRLFSQLFGSGSVTITESAVAMMAATGPVCMLSHQGGVSIGGSATVGAAGCAIASNAAGSQSIQGASAPSHVPVNQSLVSAGGCSGCTGLTSAPLTYQPPTPDPAGLTTIEGLTLPVSGVNGAKCNTGANKTTQPVAYDSAKKLNCDGLSLTGNFGTSSDAGNLYILQFGHISQ